MPSNWIVAKASVIGNSHIKENLPCQDSHGYEYFPEENFSIAVVSDGAGSADYSHLGSSKVVECALEKFATLIKRESFFISKPDETFWREKSIEIFGDILNEIKIFAETENLNYKTLAATAIVVAIMPYGIIATHVGDGRAGYMNASDNWLPCITPYKGELANETVFLTSDFWEKENLQDFIESNIVIDEIKAFTLLTDGCENVCFELNTFNKETQLYERLNRPYAGFYNHNIEVLKSLSKADLKQEEIDNLWENFLSNGNESFANEPDDKTLILGLKVLETETQEIKAKDNAE